MKRKFLIFAVVLTLLFTTGRTMPTMALEDKAAQAPTVTLAIPETKPPANPVLQTGSKSEVDIANINQGYVFIRMLNKTDKQMKVKISILDANGAETNNCVYDLDPSGKTDTYPLQMGNGNYVIKVLENKSGTSYAVIQTVSVNVKLENDFLPYLVSSKYVQYTGESQAVAKGADLTANAQTTRDKVEAVYQYIVDTLMYDTAKANKVIAGQLSGYIPDVDEILKEGKGICFDCSALMGAMLRSQGIPTKLVMGYVAPNNVYHAWNEVYIENEGWVKINGAIYFDGKTYSRMDSTFALGDKNGARSQFVGNGANYAKQAEY